VLLIPNAALSNLNTDVDDVDVDDDDDVSPPRTSNTPVFVDRSASWTVLDKYVMANNAQNNKLLTKMGHKNILRVGFGRTPPWFVPPLLPLLPPPGLPPLLYSYAAKNPSRSALSSSFPGIEDWLSHFEDDDELLIARTPGPSR